MLTDLFVEPGGPALGQIRATGRGRDREAGRHGEAKLVGHDTEVGCLATDDRRNLGEGRVVSVIKGVNVAHDSEYSSSWSQSTSVAAIPGRS